MSFTTYSFAFVFLPVVVLGVRLLSKLSCKQYQKLWLIAASVVFYAAAGLGALLWLFLSGTLSYLLARTIVKAQKTAAKKVLLGIGVIFHVGLLCFFKYFDLKVLHAALPRTGAFFFLVPLGVSFFTFQLIVFLVEVYRGKDAPSHPIDFLLYLTFFPYRTMGPIMTHADFRTQLALPDALDVTAEGLSRGAYQFILGLTKKVVIADTVAVIANNGFGGSGAMTFAAAWATALAYTFQLYFDFSGYSDMACGIGRMIGLRLPQNFDSPYKSESVSVFWRRWHMTLGRALTTSVYISLGGNRRGLPRTCINLFCVMLISGIWHGESLNFLLWGTAYGLILVFERLCEKPLEKVPLLLRRIGTFLCVTLLWVVFRAPTFAGALRVWRGMFNIKNIGIGKLAPLAQDGIINLPSSVSIAYLFAQLVLCAVLVFCFANSQKKTERFSFDNKTAFFLALLLFLCVIHMGRASVFLYENF